MSKPISINGQANFNEVVINNELPVLVDFWAPWCVPCQMMAPVLEELAKEYEGKLVVAKVDTETPENQNLAFEYQIMSIPNLKLFHKGQIIKEFIGFRPKEMFVEELGSLVK